MWENEVSTGIAVPIEKVYDYLSDFKRHPEWSKGVASVEQLTNGEVSVGTEYKASEIVPTRFTSYSRITVLEPPRLIAWEAWDGRMMRVQWAFELSAEDGRTRLVERCRAQPTSFLGKVMLTLMRKRQIPKENQESLERIRAILENPSAWQAGHRAEERDSRPSMTGA